MSIIHDVLQVVDDSKFKSKITIDVIVQFPFLIFFTFDILAEMVMWPCSIQL